MMRLEVNQGPGLEQLATNELDRYDPNGYYDDKKKKGSEATVEIGGETISYVLAPDTFLKQNANGSSIGYQESGLNFVSGRLHPAQVPFVASYIHHSGMSREDLDEIFGDEFAKLNQSDIAPYLVGATLDFAAQYLRAEEMADLIERFKNEKGMNNEIADIVFGSAASEYALQTTGSAEQIAAREKASLELYVEQVGGYITAHQKNKWTSRSRRATDFRRATGSELLQGDTLNADIIYESIATDKRYEERLPQVLDLVTRLSNLEPGTEVELGPDESGIAYLCTEVKNGTKKPPVIFKRNGESERSNVVEITGYSQVFFTSLAKRLQHTVMQELEITTKALEGVTEYVKRVGNGDRDLASFVQDKLEQLLPVSSGSSGPSLALVPYQAPVPVALAHMQNEVESRVTDLAHTFTQAPNNEMDNPTALQATNALEKL